MGFNMKLREATLFEARRRCLLYNELIEESILEKRVAGAYHHDSGFKQSGPTKAAHLDFWRCNTKF